MDIAGVKQKTMTKDAIIKELMELLRQNQRERQANDVFEICIYVDMLEKKLDIMTDEIAGLQKQLKDMRENTVANHLKQSVREALYRLEKRSADMKEQLLEVKETIISKAHEINVDFRKRGSAALNRVSEFLGIKEKLTYLREKVREGISDTDKIIGRIESFGKGIREANQKIANTFRTFADKPEIDYAEKKQKFSKTELAVKPWKWQKKAYESMKIHLDAAVDKLDNLSRNVELDKMLEKYDEISEKVHDGKQAEALTMVAESTEYQYGAEAFEECQDVIKTEKAVMTENEKNVKSKSR